MKKFLCIVALFFAADFTLSAQTPSRQLKQVLQLEMPGSSGTNGACVAWHPRYKKYYCAFAGNSTYPLAVFGPTGKLFSEDEIETMVDVRGIWYNSSNNSIEANGYDDNGWARYTLDGTGIPLSAEKFVYDMQQPDAQSVGAFDDQRKQVCFFEGGVLRFYDRSGDKQFYSIVLRLGEDKSQSENRSAKSQSESFEDYNKTTVCYTGIVDAEFALLNTEKIQIELFNREGRRTRILPLPDDAPLKTSFNFAYANSTYWLFDTGRRLWIGYK